MPILTNEELAALRNTAMLAECVFVEIMKVVKAQDEEITRLKREVEYLRGPKVRFIGRQATQASDW